MLKKGKTTFAIIKPDAIAKNYAGQIINIIEESEFKIIALKKIKPKKELFESFYEVHKERPFFEELVDFMLETPVIVMTLEKDNAVVDFRKLIGATDPDEAEEGTIRKKFGESKGRNTMHGSDSDENAILEISHFFSLAEIVK